MAGFIIAALNNYPKIPKEKAPERVAAVAVKPSLGRAATVYMRGKGFTAEDAACAVEAAENADPDLGAPEDVLERMANSATLGVMNDQVQNSLGITEATISKLMGLKGLERSEFYFRYLPTKLRLEVLCQAMARPR